MARKPKSAGATAMPAMKYDDSLEAHPYQTLRKRAGDPEAALVTPAAQPIARVMVRMPKSKHKKLRRLANDRKTTIQALMLEAVEAILAKNK